MGRVSKECSEAGDVSQIVWFQKKGLVLPGKNLASHQCTTHLSFFTSSNVWPCDMTHPSLSHNNEGRKMKMGYIKD
jgi:hypothetical protein